uniref:ARAD1C03454p n=1 Tax=Blastobotrys adeninivorans TaxID=409370 RepID=A0A060T4C9_BLAAD
MRASRILMSAAQKKSWMSNIPVEVTPLLVACGFVGVFAAYSLGAKLTSGELRTKRQGANIPHPTASDDKHH